MKFIPLLFFLLPPVILAHSNCKIVQPSLPVKGYLLHWSDEFNGNTLDRKQWNYRGLGKRGDAFNVSSAIFLDGKGHLIIKASQSEDSLLTGIIDTERNFETTYGYFECRAKLTSTNGIWPGFWLQSSRNTENGVPEKNGAEIDIFEYFQHERRDTVSHSIHWGGYSKTHQKAGPVLGPLQKTTDGFHTFGLEWTPTSYSTFVDGKVTYSGETYISKVPEFIVLSLEINKQVAGPVNLKNLPDQFTIDYVRVYKKK
ncbi:MAG: family 16 glycosylhydrolase [Chitinophagaceae bacterium]